MTAVVGILNKQAVALAADSAVTISGANNRKILNHANKIFRISNRAPVGLMLYNSASFMGTPWEVIVKVYRDQVGNVEFPSVRHYQENFIQFLRDRNFFSDEQLQKESLVDLCMAVFEIINRAAVENQSQIFLIQAQKNLAQVQILIENKIDEIWNQLTNNPNPKIPEFAGLQLQQFYEEANEELEAAITTAYFQYGITLNENRKRQLKDIAFQMLVSHNFLNRFSGLVFAGYGEGEIFPSLVPIQVSFAWRNRLRFFVEENSAISITAHMQSAIRPFAQKDVIDTILSGIDPTLRQIFITNFGEFMRKYNGLILQTIGKRRKNLLAQIGNISIETLLSEYATEMQKLQSQNYINPLMDAVATLSKEDLAEMAESLIYLTYLKRRITFAEESVGGPVDVALISKGDGFIWKKRKHYFKPELNPHFFSKYFS